MVVGGLALLAAGVVGLVWLLAGGGGAGRAESVTLTVGSGERVGERDGEPIPTWTPGPTFDWSLATRVAESLVKEQLVSEAAAEPGDGNPAGAAVVADAELFVGQETAAADDGVEAEEPEPAATVEPTPTVTPTIGPAFEVPAELLEDNPLPSIAEINAERIPEYLPGERDDEGRLIWEEVELPIVLDRQTLFPLQSAVIPAEITDFDRSAWPAPEPSRYISRQTPYVMWGFLYQFPEDYLDYAFEGAVRWWELLPELPPVLMYEEPVRLTDSSPGFLGGMAAKGNAPGLWRPGRYRVELVDGEFRTALHWEFSVR